MTDEKDTATPEVAPQADGTQPEQVASTKKEAQAPETAKETAEEKLYAGKYKSVEEMEKAHEELQSKFTKTAQEKAELERLSGQVPEEGYPPTEPSELDPAVVPALDNWYQDRREREKAAEFARKHTEELKDPVLSGTVQRLITEANFNNKQLDQEEALTQAKKLLDERIKPQVKEAQTQGEQEGAKIAQEKAKLGSVGETPTSEKFDESKLTADEWAKYKNLPRV